MPPYLGDIYSFGGDFEPRGWMFCDGRLLPISEYDTLYLAIGPQYGGNGHTTFALPTASGPAPGLHALIAVEGYSPVPGRPREVWEPDIVGFVAEWKDRAEPLKGAIPAAGQLLMIAEELVLHSIIGQKFGGNEREGTFGIPNLGGDWQMIRHGLYPSRG